MLLGNNSVSRCMILIYLFIELDRKLEDFDTMH
jgi:hypothetical protein